MSAFLNQERPEARNDFWSKAEVEIDIAASAGVQACALEAQTRCAALRRASSGCVPLPAPLCALRYACLGVNPELRFLGTQLFRLGVDWGRIIPAMPTQAGGSVPDAAALARYREIIQARPCAPFRHAAFPC